MATESTIDLQYHAYEQLYFQHVTSRREHQGVLLESLESLSHDINSSLSDDKRAYEMAKNVYRQKFNVFQRIITSPASRYKNQSLQPLKYIHHRREDLAMKVTELLQETTLETTPVEIRTQWNGSISVVYNPITGRTEWKQYRHGGIHGVYNLATRTVEWQDELHTGVYGVFNPKLNTVEWKKFYKGGVHGVYNPCTNHVEWQTSFHSGIGGVFNPLTGRVEWKTSMNGGVVGYFDYETQTIKWTEKWHHGIALIVWDSTFNTYLTTASCGWYGDN